MTSRTDTLGVRKCGTLESRCLVELLKQAPTTHIEVRLLPSGVHSLLRHGIKRQLEIKYGTYFGSPLLSAAIVKSVLNEVACDPDLARYVEENSNLIEQQAHNIRLDYPMAHAFSILVSFSLILLGLKYPEKSAALVERATELGLFLRSTKEMFDTDNAREFLDGIQQIAQDLLVSPLTTGR